jgi:hypothetical protein
MDIELKQITSTDLKNTFISQHNLSVHGAGIAQSV